VIEQGSRQPHQLTEEPQQRTLIQFRAAGIRQRKGGFRHHQHVSDAADGAIASIDPDTGRNADAPPPDESGRIGGEVLLALDRIPPAVQIRAERASLLKLRATRGV